MIDYKLKTAEVCADDICRWSARGGLRESVIRAIREAMRDQRHVCAEAVAAMDGGAVTKSHAHQVVMNATADRSEV